MKEKVIEILMFIMNEIHENKTIAEIDIADLRDRGYTQSEISAAFSWLHENMPPAETRAFPARKGIEGSRRMLHEAERHVISVEGHGFLIHLTELGLLTDADLENVIDRAMMVGFDKLSLAELQSIVAAVLFTRGGDMGGDRYMLNSSDTVH